MKIRSNSKTWLQCLGSSPLTRKTTYITVVCHLCRDATADATHVCHLRINQGQFSELLKHTCRSVKGGDMLPHPVKNNSKTKNKMQKLLTTFIKSWK